MAVIELEKVTKVFANVTIPVDEIDLSILDGEVMVLGPSGCGKTTVLPVGKGAVFAVDVSRPQFVDPASEKAAGQ